MSAQPKTPEQIAEVADNLAKVQSFDPWSAKWISEAHMLLRNLASQPAEQPRGEPVAFIDHTENGVFLRTLGACRALEDLPHGTKLYTAQPKPEQDHSRDATKMIGQAVGDGVDYLHALDQADVALGMAGLGEDDIFRVELRRARAHFAKLLTPRPAVATPAEVTMRDALQQIAERHSDKSVDGQIARAALSAQCQVRKGGVVRSTSDDGGWTEEDAKRYIRDWTPDYVKDYVASLASPSAGAVVPDGWKVERGPDVLGQPSVSVTSPEGEQGIYGIFQGERFVRDFLIAAFPLAAAPEVPGHG